MLTMLIVSSCSNTKDGFSYRLFHNTTAKYNGFFYAKESLKEANAILEEKHKEDYDEILPLYIKADEQSLNAVNEQTERIIEKTEKVIARHKMKLSKREQKKMKRPELNKWIDDNYLLLGIGYYYKENYFKAEEFFKYVTREYDEANIQAMANNWMARVYMERNEYAKATNFLTRATKERDVDPEVTSQTHMILADLYLKKEDYKKASEELQKSISFIEKKKDRARPTFILAQIKQKQGKSSEAIELYKSVVDMKPTYELVFYSKINQALAYNRRGGNSAEIKETLWDMIKDEKNIEYQDQIFYALAEIEIEEQNESKGIEYLETSIEKSINNKKQKSKSFLKLADIYFERSDYPEAQAYYDSTATNISKEHPRYKKIVNMAESLGELVSNLNVIALQDSLMEYCSLSDMEKRAKLELVQKQIKKDMKAQRLEDEQIAYEKSLEKGGGGTTESTNFWVYNDYLKEIGVNNFIDFWGERKLEDNWRRSSKTPSFSENDDPDENIDETDEDVGSVDRYPVPSVDELMKTLPCQADEMAISDSLIAAAYYNNGLIYKEKLEDFNLGIDSWETLVTERDESQFHPTAYYQLFRSFYNKEQEGYTNFGCSTCNSQHWASLIMQKYPGSEWEYLVKDPTYLVGRSLEEAQELEAYIALYQVYSSYEYIDVITQSSIVIANEPENHLLCKYRLLKAQSIGHMDGKTGQRENYLKELQTVVTECPGSDEAVKAQEILDFLLTGGKVTARKEDPKKDGDKEKEGDKEVPKDSPFTYQQASKHYMAIIVPTELDLEFTVNDIKASISDYNTNFHESLNLKSSANLFGREYHIVLVKTFKNVEEANIYKRAFGAEQDLLKDINDAKLEVVLVSKDNYLTIFKERKLLEYLEFYDATYTN